jgi:hypothetical protein
MSTKYLKYSKCKTLNQLMANSQNFVTRVLVEIAAHVECIYEEFHRVISFIYSKPNKMEQAVPRLTCIRYQLRISEDTSYSD